MKNIRDKEVIKAVGKRVRKLRKEKGLSQEKLSLKIELTRNTISRVENGDFDPTLTTLSQIARGLEIDIRDLFAFLDLEATSQEKD